MCESTFRARFTDKYFDLSDKDKTDPGHDDIAPIQTVQAIKSGQSSI